MLHFISLSVAEVILLRLVNYELGGCDKKCL